MRKIKLVNDEYYHIYNRGTDQRNIFLCDEDFIRFFKSLKEFNEIEPIGSLYEKDYRARKKLSFQLETEFPKTRKPLVEFICYCLNPNHYHFLLKQSVGKGIEKFMHRLGVGYTKYFNGKYDRSGSLFQGTFRATHIESNEQLLWVSAYINANAQIHKIVKNAEEHPWGSYLEYLGLKAETICNQSIILGQFKDLNEYQEFIKKAIPFTQERKELQKYLIEIEESKKKRVNKNKLLET